MIERPALFDRRSFAFFLLFTCAVAALSLINEYSNFRLFKRFDTAVFDAEVINQYKKTKNSKTYYVFKLRFEGNKTFYTTGSTALKDLRGRTVQVQIWPQRLTFWEYLGGFYARSLFLHVKPDLSMSERIRRKIALAHESVMMQELYGALFAAAPMGVELRKVLSASGVSHLLAISGFHLGVLSALIFALFYWPYRLMQERWFPWRHRRRDLFILSALSVLAYLMVLGWVPSLLRAFAMMLVGYLLYDRGVKVVSMQNLFIALVLLLSLWPTLIFSLGFWLSVGGVFYIFLFLEYFGHWKRWEILLGLGAWIYLMMLPYALGIFGTFSLYHPLSILWSLLFTFFYPLSILLHLFGEGGMMDAGLLWMFQSVEAEKVVLHPVVLGVYFGLSLLAIYSRYALYGAVMLALSIGVMAYM